jgi:hypothetical protein
MSCDLSVIVAQAEPDAPLSQCLAALDRACRNVHAEIVVVQASGIAPESVPVCHTPSSTLRLADRPLVPQLWSQGLAVARGRYIAFTLANCEVSDGWAASAIAALQAGASGVAGPIACAPGVGLVNRAVYFLRYSSFGPSRIADADVPGEIPGDNAVYPREALERHRDVVAEGFWEVLFHRRLRREGGRLCTRRAVSARFLGGVSLRQAVRHRFAHGRHFGAWRAGECHRPRWQIVVAAPAVPFLLGFRAASRVMRSAPDRWSFVFALPAFLVVASAWASGEAVGALYGAALPAVRVAGDDARHLSRKAAGADTLAVR